jgi:hypothetical protein
VLREDDNGRITGWEPRLLVFTHPAKKLAGRLDVRGDEPGPLVARLEPWGAAVGRLIDGSGKPLRDLTLWTHVKGRSRLGGGTIEHRPGRVRTDAEGRFHIEGLAPGLAYVTSVQSPPGRRVRPSPLEIRPLKAGETLDLGAVVVEFLMESAR